MNSEGSLAEIRRLIGSAQQEEALRRIEQWVGQANGPQQRWRNTVVVLRSRLEKLLHQQRLHTARPEDIQLGYNKLSEDLLDLVDRLEKGEAPPLNEMRARRRPIIYAAVGLGVIGLLAWIFIWWSNWNSEGGLGQPAAGNCPVFDPGAEFRAAILPFQPLDNVPDQTHEAIRLRLAEQVSQYPIRADVETMVFEFGPAAMSYPAIPQDAKALGATCNTQLVVYGTKEVIPSGQRIIRTKFTFIESDGFEFTRLKLRADATVDTVTTLSSIAMEGVLTESLEYNIALLLGFIAHEVGADSTAYRILGPLAEPTNDTARLLKGMVLANASLKLNKSDDALRSLDKTLEAHPNYFLARNNRALLLYQQGEFEAAVADLEVAVEQKPNDTLTIATQAFFNIKAGRLDRVGPEIRNLFDQRAKSDSFIWATIREAYQLE